MTCAICGSKNIRFCVNVGMYIDAENFGNITKRVISKKSTELWSADYKSYICKDCGYIKDLR